MAHQGAKNNGHKAKKGFTYSPKGNPQKDRRRAAANGTKKGGK